MEGICSLRAQVEDVAKRPRVKDKIGLSSKPIGGTQLEPVKNTITSSREQSTSPSTSTNNCVFKIKLCTLHSRHQP